MEIVDVPSLPGGIATEEVEVDITVSTDSDGNVTAVAKTAEGGDVTDSGTTVNYDSTVVTDDQGNVISEDTTYDAESADGNFTAEGGTETTTRPITEEDKALLPGNPTDEIEIDIADRTQEDGELPPQTEIRTYTEGGNYVTITTPTNEGDKLQSEDPANFDQTTTTIVDRKVEVSVSESAIISGTPGYMAEKGDTIYRDEEGKVVGYRDQAGNLVGKETTAAETLEESGNPIYRDDNGNLIGYVDDDGNLIGKEPARSGHDWIENGHGSEIDGPYDKVDENGNVVKDANGNAVEETGSGLSTWYAVTYDENGNEIGRRTVDAAYVDEKRVRNTEDGSTINDLYCTDISTNFMAYYVGYRQANLEDAVEEGYYTEEEASHLRAIMKNGYTWEGKSQLDEMKAKLTEAKTNGSDEVKELLADLDIDNLTTDDAAIATNLAVWYYGNRFDLNEGETLEVDLHGNADPKVAATDPNNDIAKRRLALYSYLIALEDDTKETQVINEEKFIEDMVFTVGTKVEDASENLDDDDTNDVFNTSIKFSMVVTPGKDDELIVKVLDSHGTVLQQAKIPVNEGDAGAGYAKTLVEDGKTYYVLDGMQLAENSNTTFNLKLEGTQLLTEGVYVFESEHYDDMEALDKIAKAAKIGTGEDYKNMIIEDCLASGMTMEEAEAVLREEIERINAGQNLIGVFGGETQVDIGVQIDLTFNVEEGTVTSTRIWRHEEDPAPEEGGGDDGGGRGTPRTGRRTLRGGGAPVTVEEEPVPLDANITIKPMENADGTLTIIDEEVPLADAAVTGDASFLWAILGSASTAAYLALGSKKKKH